ncbi:MAG: C_GCAxxG_C_C family protein [Eubacteriaceae bacterium]|nr:C_GCAxxG_C_C family protein [Eubacteriaceae bacterium]
MDDIAFGMFKLANAGYCCSQIMIKMVLDLEEKENSDLIGAANGLCLGMGGLQKTCGVLAGGILILGLYAGKRSDTTYPRDEFYGMLKEYTEWFEDEFESTDCIDIIGVCDIQDYTNNQQYRMKCGDILTKNFEKLLQILEENGFEFGNREN